MRSKYGAQVGFGASTRPLNTYLYPHGFRDHNTPAISRIGWALDMQLDLPAFRCPADDGPSSSRPPAVGACSQPMPARKPGSS